MKLLDEIIRRLPKSSLTGFRLLAVQHLLESISGFNSSLNELGLSPHDSFFIGKPYSAIASVSDLLSEIGVTTAIPVIPRCGEYRLHQQRAISHFVNQAGRSNRSSTNKLILLDEGGDLLRALSSAMDRDVPICGIEQTQSGLSAITGTSFPVIQVADSSVKRFLEPPIIARELLKAIAQIPAVMQSRTIGVIGTGALGSRLATTLSYGGANVFVYDHSSARIKALALKSPTITICENTNHILKQCDTVLGCTGSDVLEHVDWGLSQHFRAKHFISCSSGDYEFLSLLRQHPLSSKAPKIIEDITVRAGRKEVVVYNGGYPINFNRVAELSSPDDIQITRALLLGAVLQAAEILRRKTTYNGGVMLCPHFQRFVAKQWLKLCPGRKSDYDDDVLIGMQNEQWIASHSGGKEIHAFESTTFKFE